MRKVFISFMILSGVATCLFGLSGSSANGENKSSIRDITFAKEVAPIFFKSCGECHRPGEIAPFSVLSYKDDRLADLLL